MVYRNQYRASMNVALSFVEIILAVVFLELAAVSVYYFIGLVFFLIGLILVIAAIGSFLAATIYSLFAYFRHIKACRTDPDVGCKGAFLRCKGNILTYNTVCFCATSLFLISLFFPVLWLFAVDLYLGFRVVMFVIGLYLKYCS